MYAIEVRDHVMIAHGFKGELFGPAQKLHGATFIVDAAFFCEQLTKEGVVVDIGRATETLSEILTPLRYQNLDTLPQFEGKNTTTEFLAGYIFDELAKAARHSKFGPGSEGVKRIRVTLHESHLAKAWYEGAVA